MDNQTSHFYCRAPRLGAARCAAAVLSASLAVVLPPEAHAALGGDATSIISDRNALSSATASAKSTLTAASRAATSSASTSATASTAGYTVATVIDSGGTTIHEYLGSDGTVFAIAWSGPFMPDLHQLFGTYYLAYTNATSAALSQRTGRGPVMIDDGELVVHSGGRMRAFNGTAYLKSRLPTGFTVNQIR